MHLHYFFILNIFSGAIMNFVGATERTVEQWKHIGCEDVTDIAILLDLLTNAESLLIAFSQYVSEIYKPENKTNHFEFSSKIESTEQLLTYEEIRRHAIHFFLASTELAMKSYGIKDEIASQKIAREKLVSIQNVLKSMILSDCFEEKFTSLLEGFSETRWVLRFISGFDPNSAPPTFRPDGPPSNNSPFAQNYLHFYPMILSAIPA